MKLCRFFSGSFLFFERPAERDRFAFPSQANLPVEDHFSRGYGYEIDTFRQEIHETGCQVTLRDPIRPKINSRSRDLSSLHRFRCIRSTLSFFSNPCLLFKRISDIYIYIQISNQSLYFLRKKFFQQRPFLLENTFLG